MRDGILNNTESAPEMENLVADFVVSIGVALFDTGKSLGCSLRIDRHLMPFIQIGEHIELGHIISVARSHRFSRDHFFPMETESLWQRVGTALTILQAHFQSLPWEVLRREWSMYISR